jgi:phospholipid N-methyltransferase
VAVVSSLPFRSLPPRWSEPTRMAIEHFLLAGAHRRLVQYTYQPRVPFDLRGGDRLHWQRGRVVWRNAPPAWVWTLAVRG